MTLIGIIAHILHFFTKFNYSAGQLRDSSINQSINQEIFNVAKIEIGHY